MVFWEHENAGKNVDARRLTEEQVEERARENVFFADTFTDF